MGLDIRLPIGMMFGLLGSILVITGFLNDTVLNIQCGACMAVFGAVMLALGLRAQRRAEISTPGTAVPAALDPVKAKVPAAP